MQGLLRSFLIGLLVFLPTVAQAAPMPIPQMGPPLEKAAPSSPSSDLQGRDDDAVRGLSRNALSPAQILRLHSSAVVMVMSKMPKEGPVRGSGFFINREGLIVTSHHLVDGASEIRVKDRSGKVREVDVVTVRPDADLAVLRARGEVPGVLMLADSDEVQVGERVVVIGHPLGLEYTLSSGIVSALRSAQSRGVELIQFSAPVSPGCSGGPIINDSGEVVGIVALSHPEGQNLNFAIPSNSVRGILREVAMPDGLPGSVDESMRLAGAEVSASVVALPSLAPADTSGAAGVPAGVDLVPDTPVVQIAPTWRHSVFHLGQRGFRVDSPQSWRVQSHRDESSLTVSLMSPDERISMRMITVPVAAQTGLDAFAGHVVRAVQNALDVEGRKAARTAEPMDGVRAPRLVRVTTQSVAGNDWKMYVHRYTGSDGADHYAVSMMTLREGQGYVLRYTAPVAGWERTREDVRKLLGTVAIF